MPERIKFQLVLLQADVLYKMCESPPQQILRGKAALCYECVHSYCQGLQTLQELNESNSKVQLLAKKPIVPEAVSFWITKQALRNWVKVARGHAERQFFKTKKEDQSLSSFNADVVCKHGNFHLSMNHELLH